MKKLKKFNGKTISPEKKKKSTEKDFFRKIKKFFYGK